MEESKYLEFSTIGDACCFLANVGYLSDEYKSGLVNINLDGHQYIKIIDKEHDLSVDIEPNERGEYLFTVIENNDNKVNIVCNDLFLTDKHNIQ